MRDIIVWGTGERARAITGIIEEVGDKRFEEIRIVAFVDNIKKRESFLHRPVIKQEKLMARLNAEGACVMISVDESSKAYQDISCWCEINRIKFLSPKVLGISSKEISTRIIKDRGNADATLFGKYAPLRTPYEVYIDTCSKCNLVCGFCPTNMVKEGHELRNQVMSFSVFEKIVEDLKLYKDKINVVRLQQFGEPLLNPRLPEMVRLLKDADVCNYIHIVSNGTLLNPKLNQELIDAGVDIFRVSVNGLDTETYKKVCGVAVDFDSFVANIADFFYRAGGVCQLEAKITTASLKTDEDYERFKRIFYPITDYVFCERVEEVWEPYEMPKYDDELVTVGSRLLSDEALPVCPVPFDIQRVFSNGGVHVCCGDWNHRTQIGNVMDDTLPGLWQCAEMQKIRRRHLELPREEISEMICENCRRLWRGVDIDRNTGIFTRTRPLRLAPSDGKMRVIPNRIQIDVSSVCNFQCDFCPTNNKTPVDPDFHRIMDMPLFEKIVTDIKGFGGMISDIQLFCQGEPLLNPEFPNMVRMVKDAAITEMVTTTTNASRLSRSMSDALIDAGLDQLLISVNAMNAEDYRVFTKYDLDFDEFVDQIRYFYERSRGKTRLLIKLSTAMVSSVEQLREFAAIFQPISDEIRIETPRDQWNGYEGTINKGAGIGEFKAYELPTMTSISNCLGVCDFPFSDMMIFSNGDVGLCCMDSDHGTKYGNARTDNLVELWNSEVHKQICRDHYLGGKDRNVQHSYCRDCKYDCL